MFAMGSQPHLRTGKRESASGGNINIARNANNNGKLTGNGVTTLPFSNPNKPAFDP
jgi:hypothetical protein